MSLADLKGYSVPLSPNGRAQVVGGLPWNFGVDLFAVHYRADPREIAKLLPEPLEPSREEPDGAYVWFGDWQGLWSGHEGMLGVNPERCLYKECLIGVRCSYKGIEGQRVVYIWVNKDFSMQRGWFMGFPKKIGMVELGSQNRHLHDLNPAMRNIGVGAGQKYAAIAESHGERLVTAAITLKERITPDKLPKPFGTDLFHTIHFPGADVTNPDKPLVHQLIQTVSSNLKFGEIWSADGELEYHASIFEEHTAIGPKQITGAYLIPVGFTIEGTRLLHSY
ncbi:MAG: acetoacetate decarboxylase family protein [Gammaproteobacteria bacterium]|nr:acetoacetate decarboxylase family protein [Gammaproteobacteria bacterium]